MNKYISLILIFVLLIFAIPSESKLPRLVIAGSTTILPLSERLASKYREEVGVEVLVQGGGSSAGLNAVLNGVAQIAASSRKLTKDEKEKLHPFVIGRDVIAIVVHPSNPIRNISMKQLRDVLSGRITNWKELGLPIDKQILLVNDSAGAGTRAAIEELVMGKNKQKGSPGRPMTLMSVVVNSSAEMKSNVSGSKYAIGYLPFNYLDSTVKPISINKIFPSYAAAYKRGYPLFRDLYYAIKKDSIGLGRAYIYYVLSPDGQDVVVKEGFLPVKLITTIRELERIWKNSDLKGSPERNKL